MKHRVAEIELTVANRAGEPLGRRAISLRQVRQKFLFGCNIYGLFEIQDAHLEQAYEERFCELFNYATLPFYLGHYQPTPEKTDRGRLTRMAEFCHEQGLATKGHPLVWHETVPQWLNEIPPEDVEAVLLGRIRREIRDFAGLINIWDVVNEPVVMSSYKPNAVTELCGQLGQVELLVRAFATARETAPTATLVLNDYDTTPKYERLLEQAIERGVSFDVIGIQSHMHKEYWGAEKIRDVCDRFARFSKPLHFTELTILSGPLKTDDDWHGPHPGWDSTPAGEELQARQAEEVYRTLYEHPAVEAITWWDFSDYAAWQGAPAGLLRKDMTPKPACDALLDLIKKQWWTAEQHVKTDVHGKLRFEGHLGEYELSYDGKPARFSIDKPGASKLRITL